MAILSSGTFSSAPSILSISPLAKILGKQTAGRMAMVSAPAGKLMACSELLRTMMKASPLETLSITTTQPLNISITS